MAPVKILGQYRVIIDLPDDKDHKNRQEAYRLLKEKGCTSFDEHKYYDINFDGLKLAINGFVIELV